MKAYVMILAGGLLAVGCGGRNEPAEQRAPMSPPAATVRDTTPSAAAGGDMHHDMQAMNDRMLSMLGPDDGAYEHRFIDTMIPHHEGAILMAKHAIDYANRPELKKLAQDIIDSQAKEIESMKMWRLEWYGASADDAMPNGSGMMSDMQAMNQMMVQQLGVRDTAYERRFIDLMIPHHEGAIAMAQDALQKAHRPELKALAKRIIAGQQQEIAQMEVWRKQW